MERLDLISELNLKEFKEIFKKDLIKSFFTLKSILVFLCFFSITIFITIFFRTENMVFNNWAIAGLCVAFYFIIILVKVLFNGYYAEQRFNEYEQMVSSKVTVNKDEISIFVKDTEIHFQWNELEKMQETKKLIMLFAKNRGAIYISKSAFKTREEAEFFNECAKNMEEQKLYSSTEEYEIRGEQEE